MVKIYYMKKLNRNEFAKLIEFYVLNGYDISGFMFRPASFFNHEFLRKELNNFIEESEANN